MPAQLRFQDRSLVKFFGRPPKTTPAICRLAPPSPYMNIRPPSTIEGESDLQILYRLTWYGTTRDVTREANDGRGPADFKISRDNRNMASTTRANRADCSVMMSRDSRYSVSGRAAPASVT